MRFYQVLYSMFPSCETEFQSLEKILERHYQRKLELLRYPESDPSEEEIEKLQEIVRLIVDKSEPAERFIGKEVPLESLTKLVKHNLKFLANSYLVKSASLLESFIWSVNQKNAFVTAMSIRQEIEVLAMAHYANNLVDNENKDPLELLPRLLFGQTNRKPYNENGSETYETMKPIHVLKAIRDYVKEMKSPWLLEYYDWLSEIVHPNYLSNIIHVKDNQHFWKCDYMRNKILLEKFLEMGLRVFGQAIDEISKIPPENLEAGFKFVRKK